MDTPTPQHNTTHDMGTFTHTHGDTDTHAQTDTRMKGPVCLDCLLQPSAFLSPGVSLSSPSQLLSLSSPSQSLGRSVALSISLSAVSIPHAALPVSPNTHTHIDTRMINTHGSRAGLSAPPVTHARTSPHFTAPAAAHDTHVISCDGMFCDVYVMSCDVMCRWTCVTHMQV